MDTTQAFGISAASGKSKVLSGSAQFLVNVETTTTINDTNFVIFEVNGGGIANTGLTGLDWREVSSGGYIQNAQKIKRFFFFGSTNAASARDYELYVLTCSPATYTSSTTIDFTPSVSIETIPVGGFSAFETRKIDLPVGFVHPTKGDIVGFGLKNVSGGNVGGMNAQLAVIFENTL